VRGGRIDLAGEIGDEVHEIDIGIIGAFKGVEIFVDIAIAEPFGTHVIKVV
jgi:hypothetical protein